MTRHTDEELDALVALTEEFVTATWHLLDNSEMSGPKDDPIIAVWQPDFDEVSALLDRCEGLPSGSTEHMAAGELLAANMTAAITTIRTQLAEVKAEKEKLGREVNLARYGQPDFSWQVHKEALAEANARADRAEAERAAQIEVDAGLIDALYRMALKDSDADLSSPWKSHKASAYGTALQAIRSQPHDCSALDRMLAEAREKVLREAIIEGMRIAIFTPIEQVPAAIDDAIRALIEAHNAQP